MKSARRRICALAATQTSIDGTGHSERERERVGKKEREDCIENQLHFRVTPERESERLEGQAVLITSPNKNKFHFGG